MTLAAVWFDSDRIYAVADTRIIREPGNVHTDHGPKLLSVSIVCKQPGPAGFFDQIAYRTTIGFTYAGSTLSALCTHALANTLFQNLIGNPGSPPPQLAEIVGAIRGMAHHYMQEVGELSGPQAMFDAILFGFCGATNGFKAFTLKPTISEGLLQVIVTEEDICAPGALLVIGDQPERLLTRVAELRADAHPEVAADAPRRALRAIISEGANPGVGGAVQYGWVTRQGFEPIADGVPISPPLPSGRNLASQVLGFDILDLPPLGSYVVGMTGRV